MKISTCCFWGPVVLGAISCSSFERARATRALAPIATPARTAGITSSLWGFNGDRFNPAGRLMDFSYAGYRQGDAPLPDQYQAEFDAAHFGVVADGTTDDTAAIIRAVNAASAETSDGERAVVQLPAGHLLLTDIIRINQSKVTLRGAGSDKTILQIRTSLNQILGAGPGGSEVARWGANGGFIWAKGTKQPSQTLAAVTTPARRGDTRLTLSSTNGVVVGQRIRLVLSDDVGGTLLRHLEGDLMDGGAGLTAEERTFDSFTSVVIAIKGNTITLQRSLPTDVRLAWKPQILKDAPTLTEVGVEGLTILFPPEPAPAHHEEVGHNGICFENVANSWIRDIRIVNADNDILIQDSRNVTATEIVISDFGVGRSNRDGFAGHHGFETGHSADVLVCDFQINSRLRHAISFDRGFGNVFANGRGTDMNMGLHRRSPYSNLFTNLDLGAGTIPYLGSGRTDRGPRSGAYTTYWNIRATKDVGLPKELDLGPKLNFIGVSGATSAPAGTSDWFVEPFAPQDVIPQNLYEAQLTRRHRRRETR